MSEYRIYLLSTPEKIEGRRLTSFAIPTRTRRGRPQRI